MGRRRRPARFPEVDGRVAAFAGLSGCGRTPEQYVVPYVKQPDGLTLGKPQFYATAMPFGADAIGLLVESHEGRPTKIEGNPDHPSSLGATNVFAQASVLNLYDPDRAQNGHEIWGNPDVVSVCGKRASPRGGDERHERRRFPHPNRDCHFADACRSDSVATNAFSEKPNGTSGSPLSAMVRAKARNSPSAAASTPSIVRKKLTSSFRSIPISWAAARDTFATRENSRAAAMWTNPRKSMPQSG